MAYFLTLGFEILPIKSLRIRHLRAGSDGVWGEYLMYLTPDKLSSQVGALKWPLSAGGAWPAPQVSGAASAGARNPSVPTLPSPKKPRLEAFYQFRFFISLFT